MNARLGFTTYVDEWKEVSFIGTIDEIPVTGKCRTITKAVRKATRRLREIERHGMTFERNR